MSVFNVPQSADEPEAPIGPEPSPSPAPVVSPRFQTMHAAPGSTAFQFSGDLIKQSLRWAPMEPIDRTEIDTIAKVYVPTPHFIDARDVILNQLGSHNGSPVLVLNDELGTGRRSTAIRLLTEVPDLSLYEIQPDWESPRTELLPVQEKCGYLLDLSYEDDVPSSFGNHLANLRQKIEAAGSRLIVTVTPSVWRNCQAVTASFTRPVGVPDDVDRVIDGHLRLDKGKLDRFWPVEAFPEPLAELVTELRERRSAPGKILDLVTAMRGEQEFTDEAIERIRDEFHQWSTYLDGQFTRPKDTSPAGMYHLARRRALLITVAVLDGAPATSIFNSSFELLKQLKAAPSADELLIGPELTELVDDINAENVDGGITLTRHFPGLDKAVVNRIWQERPGLRDIILAWLAAITTDKTMALQQIDRVATVVTALAVEQRSIEVLDEVVQGWLSEGTRHQALAITILDHLTVSPDIGSAVRQRLYQWAKSSKLDAQILSGVAKVCTGQLAQRHLPAALIRLRWLAMQDNETVQNDATTALRELAQDFRLRPRIVQHVLEWTKEPSTRASGRVAFLELMSPSDNDTVFDDILTDVENDMDIKAKMRDEWSQLLNDGSSRDHAVTVMSACLDYADNHPEHHATILDMIGPGFKLAMAQGAGEALLSKGTSTSRVKLVQLLATGFTASPPSWPAAAPNETA